MRMSYPFQAYFASNHRLTRLAAQSLGRREGFLLLLLRWMLRDSAAKVTQTASASPACSGTREYVRGAQVAPSVMKRTPQSKFAR
mmetsp:Transcript_68501/g.155236  ORF Transcript_68501/g.155236 Transcript_68501/m.155236 type:complete len:85 (-) Transcript_68501:214-468(-)